MSLAENITAFERCIIRTRGGKSIRCRLGLWSVDAPNRDLTEREAMRYWLQYFSDGEYESLLNATATKQH